MTAFEFVWETFQIGVDNYNLGYVWEDCIVSLKISVIVLQNGEALGQKANKRPVRVMPDGISGVVFNGCVYPVYCDLTIETNDPCYEPSECTTFVENEKEIVYKDNSNPISKNINLKWTTQFSPSRKYLLFDSDEIFAEKLFSILENEGLAHRLAESFKPAKDGYFYDWAQASWELLVERIVCSPNESFVIYGSGSDYEADIHSRVFFHKAEATHEIICLSKSTAIDSISGAEVDLTMFDFDAFVSINEEWFDISPPFNHILLTEKGAVEADYVQVVVPIDQVSLRAQKIEI